MFAESPLTKAAAYTKYARLVRRATIASKKNDHFKRFIGAVKLIRNFHPIDHSEEVTPCVMDSQTEVAETLPDSLDVHSEIFCDEFFTSTFFPV